MILLLAIFIVISVVGVLAVVFLLNKDKPVVMINRKDYLICSNNNSEAQSGDAFKKIVESNKIYKDPSTPSETKLIQIN